MGWNLYAREPGDPDSVLEESFGYYHELEAARIGARELGKDLMGESILYLIEDVDAHPHNEYYVSSGPHLNRVQKRKVPSTEKNTARRHDLKRTLEWPLYWDVDWRVGRGTDKKLEELKEGKSIKFHFHRAGLYTDMTLPQAQKFSNRYRDEMAGCAPQPLGAPEVAERLTKEDLLEVRSLSELEDLPEKYFDADQERWQEECRRLAEEIKEEED